jgi:hypothetical protein
MKRLMLFLAVGLLPAVTLADDLFRLNNRSDEKIIAIEVSEDGRAWGAFDIGIGIDPGTSVDLAWDESTNGSDCDWFFRARFDDGDWSDPQSFNFCQDGLELTFS